MAIDPGTGGVCTAAPGHLHSSTLFLPEKGQMTNLSADRNAGLMNDGGELPPVR